MTRSSTKVTRSSQTSARGCQCPDYWFTVYISLTVRNSTTVD